MGDKMQEDDIYIASLFDVLNLRFAPTPEPEWMGGIKEMTALQKEFKIFQKGRSFKDSVAFMNMGGFWNSRAKTRWYELLEDLEKYGSNKGQNANDDIVTALIANLESRNPLPIYFKAHNYGDDKRVLIEDKNSRPIFYIATDYLTISIPMRPKRKR